MCVCDSAMIFSLNTLFHSTAENVSPDTPDGKPKQVSHTACILLLLYIISLLLQ